MQIPPPALKREALLVSFVVWTVLALGGLLAGVDSFFLKFQGLKPVFELISLFGRHDVLFALALIYSINAGKKERKEMAGGLVSLSIAVDVLKRVFRRARPVVSDSFAYPSGHSTLAFFFYTFLFLKKRSPLYLLPAILIPASRIVLGAHWFSDVVGGILLASLWLALIFEERERKAGP